MSLESRQTTKLALYIELPVGRALQPDESPTFVETWKEMEKLLDTGTVRLANMFLLTRVGKVRSIGISNFSQKNLDILLPQVKIVPAVNQVG